MVRKKGVLVLIISILVSLLVACGVTNSSAGDSEGDQNSEPVNSEKTSEPQDPITLTIGAYTVPKEAVQEIIPLFQEYWKEEKGQTVTFTESYDASGSQTRAILEGFEADIALLSLEGDIEKLVEANLITHDWKSKPFEGMITGSVVALGVREGNPKNIQDWSDLTKEGVEVLIPNPKTSGGAQWDVNAIYGAGLKISEEEGGQNPNQAKEFLSQVYKNVKTLDKSGRASMTTFEKGIGDVIVTYENELLARNLAGENYEIIVPKYTIDIRNPAAVIDKNVDAHGVREAAEAFVDFLWTPEAQTIFAQKGFRAVEPNIASEFADQYKTPEGLFGIDYLGGWSQVSETIYADGAIWDQVLSGE
ncbi:sulfate ABC transporter substrate-binding protein [Halalkalibacterium ligniniphilum]|uniref:sulfate ABC transporter substrate-binding protein n=1 Tax=Halalkalibacterium ligniniphilum TaxID=1134413 RepID=UPI000345113C|nr:sulfate ABC transporter substrate-binding protein [Halalkalibacterium ligniniphilum]